MIFIFVSMMIGEMKRLGRGGVAVVKFKHFLD